MIEVGDMPQVGDEEDEDEDSDEEEEEEEDEEEDEEEEEEGEEVDAKPPSAEEAAAKLEALRLHRALGNDGAPSDPESEEEAVAWSDDEDADSDSSAESVAATDYTQYVRAPKAPRARVNVSKVGKPKLGKVDELKEAVAAEMRSKNGPAKRGVKVGNAKGHKWKTSAAYLTGRE